MMRNIGIPQKELRAIDVLNGKGVDCLLIGGYAMRFYGATRNAKDVDLFIRNSPENASKLIEAINEIIGHIPGFIQDDILKEPPKRIRFQNDGYELEILTSIDNLSFDVAKRVQKLTVENGVTIPVISKEHLVEIKKVVAKRAESERDQFRQDKELSDVQFLKGI